MSFFNKKNCIYKIINFKSHYNTTKYLQITNCKLHQQ